MDFYVPDYYPVIVDSVLGWYNGWSFDLDWYWGLDWGWDWPWSWSWGWGWGWFS